MSAFWHFIECTGKALIQVLSLTAKGLNPRAVLENCATLEGGVIFSLRPRKKMTCQNSAMVGAELRTMKRLQGWSRFGSTFFLC